MPRTKNRPDFNIEHLSRLRGGAICNVIVDRTAVAEFGQPLYGLQVIIPATSGQPERSMHVWILCDPEGNGPGFLEIEEVQSHDAR